MASHRLRLDGQNGTFSRHALNLTAGLRDMIRRNPRANISGGYHSGRKRGKHSPATSGKLFFLLYPAARLVLSPGASRPRITSSLVPSGQASHEALIWFLHVLTGARSIGSRLSAHERITPRAKRRPVPRIRNPEKSTDCEVKFGSGYSKPRDYFSSSLISDALPLLLEQITSRCQACLYTLF